ncbi:MAG: 4Fe-4S dicluster domain-containing protein [Actinomycetota bacterium]|nr:MAG: 4Fe-4S dicluster domain-containing protein [Actinomycetota bacterium]
MTSKTFLLGRLEISDSCTACGACLWTCHSKALHKGRHKPVFMFERCDFCFACIEVCPRDAIFEVSP